MAFISRCTHIITGAVIIIYTLNTSISIAYHTGSTVRVNCTPVTGVLVLSSSATRGNGVSETRLTSGAIAVNSTAVTNTRGTGIASSTGIETITALTCPGKTAKVTLRKAFRT